jgi:hypothetical protein
METCHLAMVGNGICSEKIPQFPLFCRRNGSFQGIPRSTEESIPKLENETGQNEMEQYRITRKKLVLQKQPLFLKFRLLHFEKVMQTESFLFQQRELRTCFLSRNAYASMLLILFHKTEFRVVFSSSISVFRGIIFLSEIPNPPPCQCMVSSLRTN